MRAYAHNNPLVTSKFFVLKSIITIPARYLSLCPVGFVDIATPEVLPRAAVLQGDAGPPFSTFST